MKQSIWKRSVLGLGLLAAIQAVTPVAAATGGCVVFDRCLAQGRQAVDRKDTKTAIAMYETAATLAGGNNAQLAEAYAGLSAAHEAAGDYVSALAYIERARTVSPYKQAAIEKSYKTLLAAHPSMTAADIQRKLAMDQSIASSERVQFAAVDADTASAAVEPDEGGGYTANMGQVRGIGLDVASAETNEEYKPKPRSSSHSASHSQPRSAKPARSHAPAEPSRPRQAATSHKKPRYAGASRSAGSYEHLPSLELRINFEYNSAVLTPDGARQADELGQALSDILRKQPGARFILLGHTDLYGSEGYNLALSRDRANSVKSYLSANFSALASSLRAEGAGKRAPLFEDTDEASQRLNRRVEVKQLM